MIRFFFTNLKDIFREQPIAMIYDHKFTVCYVQSLYFFFYGKGTVHGETHNTTMHSTIPHRFFLPWLSTALILSLEC